MLMVSPKQCGTKQALVRLWLHESMRVFHDRLIDDQDKNHFRNLLLELVGKNLGSAVGSPQELFPEGSSIIFGDFLKPGLDPQARPYEEVSPTAVHLRHTPPPPAPPPSQTFSRCHFPH